MRRSTRSVGGPSVLAVLMLTDSHLQLRYFGRSSGPYFAQGLAEAFAPSGLQMDVSNSLVEDLLVASVRDRQQACELPPPDLVRLFLLLEI